MRRVPLVLRGLWWRLGLTAAVLAVAVITTTSAALGPLYARAAAESILQDHLTQAGWTAGIHLSADLDVGSPGGYRDLEAKLPAPGSIHGYGRLIRGLYTPSGTTASLPSGRDAAATHLVWRDGECNHLVIVSGHCPTERNQVIVSQRTVESGSYGWQLGATLELGSLREGGLLKYGPQLPPAKVVGIYRPADTASSYWFGQDYFDGHLGSADMPDTVDSLFVAETEFLTLPRDNYLEADFDYPLTPSAVRLAGVAAERAAVATLLAAHPQNSTIPAQSGLAGVLSAAAHERRVVDTATLLVTVQLALLAWLVLFQIVSDAIEARGNEIAMAKLRGHPPGRTIRFGLGEPLVLLAVAVPAGLLLALLITHAFAASILVTGVPVVLTLPALWTTLIAFGGGLVAAVLAGHRTLTRSVLDQWRRTTRAPGHGRPMLVVDLLLAAAASTGLVLLREQRRAGSTGNTAALLAPGLLVFAVAIIGVRILPLACRGLARGTRGSRRIGLFLAVRQVARRPVGLRLVAFLAVAVGLATFAVAGESVASRNRSARAGAELGARRVVSVQFDPSLDPVTLTQKADPGGSWAMTAATWLPDGGDSIAGTVLGIDSSRLAAVGNPVSGGLGTRELAAAIGSTAVAPITLTAPQLRVHLTAADLTGDQPPDVQLNLRTARNPYLNVEGGAIRAGSHIYLLRLPCARGCTLRGLTWDRPVIAQDPLRGSITLTGLDVGDGTTWTPLDIGLDKADSWYPEVPEGQASDRIRVTSAGVQDSFSNENGGYAGIAYAADPSPMPAVATEPALVTGAAAPRRPQVLDFTNTTAYFRVVDRVPVLPAVLADGVVMDIRFLQDELPGFAGEASWQVWLGAKAPRDALARLEAAGYHIESVHTQAARLKQLGRQAPALALLLLLACAVAGAVLAVGGTTISISASSRRRSYEIAALRAVGVSRRSLLRAGLGEQLLLLGTAVLLGVPTGWLAARLAMPAIPEFADRTPIALHYTPQLMPVVLLAGAFVVLLTLTALVAARALIRIAVPARLRDAE